MFLSDLEIVKCIAAFFQLTNVRTYLQQMQLFLLAAQGRRSLYFVAGEFSFSEAGCVRAQCLSIFFLSS